MKHPPLTHLTKLGHGLLITQMHLIFTWMQSLMHGRLGSANLYLVKRDPVRKPHLSIWAFVPFALHMCSR